MKGIKRLFTISGITILLTDIVLMLAGIKLFPFLAAGAALALLSAVFFDRKHLRQIFCATVAVLIGCLSFGIAFLGVYTPSLRYVGMETSVEGTAADYSANGRVVLKNCTVGGNKTKLSFTVYLPDDIEAEPGDVLKITETEIRTTQEAGNVFFFHTLSGRAWLNCSAYFTGVNIEKADGYVAFGLIKSLRHKANEKLATFMSEDTAGIASALITGNKADIDDDTAQNLRYAGISHIFAVSGMHLSIWSGLIFLAFRRGSKNKKIPLIAALIFVLFYVVFTGFSPSVLRSGIMLALVFSGRLFRRQADALNSLGFAATLLLLVNPFLAGNVSFLLSAVATFAIIWLYPVVETRKQTKKNVFVRKADKLLKGITLSLTVIFANIPVCALFFGYVSLLSPISSIVCTPIAEVIMILSAVSLLTPSGLCRLPMKLCELTCKLMINVAGGFAKLGFAICPLENRIIIPWFFATWASVLILYFVFRKQRRFVPHLIMLSSLFLLVSASVGLIAQRNDVTVYIPQSGSASCIVLEDKTGSAAVIIGAGGNYSSAKAVETELMRSCIRDKKSLIIPRDKKSENGAHKYFSDFCSEENTVNAAAGNAEFFDNDSFSWSSDDKASTGRIIINGKEIVLCFYPSSDLSGIDMSGDILICRAFIPESVDTEKYERVIVMSERSAVYLDLPQNAVSTADGEIKFTIKDKG